LSTTGAPETSEAAGARVGVVVFPGSNDDRDLAGAFALLGADVAMVWHRDAKLPERLDGIAVPGGFSYGDYLRAGAMARFSPVMRAVEAFARGGGPVLGVCNGFQVLCESGLLPGALVRNRDLRFVCRYVRVRVEDTGQFKGGLAPGTELELPIKHGEGAYVPDPARPPRVAFRYVGENPNGSTDAIAGVANEVGNVLGLMPHPEHAVDPALLRSTDGAALLRAFLARCGQRGQR
jgi:phosphoribosylformylglycinamidine synthase